MNIAEWSQVVFNLGAILAGFWAVFQYIHARRIEAARWTQELFENFYVKDHFSEGRDLLEYEYRQVLVPLLRMRVLDRDLPLDKKQRVDLANIDKLLNYFEHLKYLVETGNINDKDREVFFEHWFGIMSSCNSSTLRRYLRECGYERLAEDAVTQHDELVAISPKLSSISDFSNYEDGRALAFYGEMKLPIEIGDDFHFTPSKNFHSTRVFRIADCEIFHILDAVVGFQRGDLSCSPIQRFAFRDGSGQFDVWAHVKI